MTDVKELTEAVRASVRAAIIERCRLMGLNPRIHLMHFDYVADQKRKTDTKEHNQ